MLYNYLAILMIHLWPEFQDPFGELYTASLAQVYMKCIAKITVKIQCRTKGEILRVLQRWSRSAG